MARAICKVRLPASDPDMILEYPGNPEGRRKRYLWQSFEDDARRQYAAHKAMMEAQHAAGACPRCGNIGWVNGSDESYGQTCVVCPKCGFRP